MNPNKTCFTKTSPDRMSDPLPGRICLLWTINHCNLREAEQSSSTEAVALKFMPFFWDPEPPVLAGGNADLLPRCLPSSHFSDVGYTNSRMDKYLSSTFMLLNNYFVMMSSYSRFFSNIVSQLSLKCLLKFLQHFRPRILTYVGPNKQNSSINSTFCWWT